MPEDIRDLELNISYNPNRDNFVKINNNFLSKDQAFDNEILESLGRDITDNLKGK